MIFMLLLPLIAAYKIFKKEKIGYTEIFIFMWILVTFFLITRGVRFSLLFSTATVVAAGYSIGNLHNYLKNRGTAIKATFYGFLLVTIVIFISTAITVGYSGEGMAISSNWYNMLDWLKANANPKSLVVTWWDPGHIITGYTGLRAMADGAHCGIGKCIPYNHNFRIQDMGATFSTSNENDSIQILSAYRQLTPEQCAEDRSIFGDKVPADACDQIPEMYVIASSDLVGKYYWLSYFGSCITKYGVGNSSYCHVLAPDQFEKIAQGRNFLQLSITNYDPNNGVITYGDGQLSLAYKDGKWVPVLNFPTQGIRNVVVKDVVYFENGQQKSVTFNDTQAIDGMVWVDPSYRVVIFMDATIRDSIFTRMFFFNGEGLQHFKLVFQNSEIKMFKVVW
jgi:dolichyl-diphosphooligosaccharide--protein glycosyltransferase